MASISALVKGLMKGSLMLFCSFDDRVFTII